MMPKTLAQWLLYLEQLHPTAIDLGLERVRQVAQRLALGRLASQIVVVAGTNGKGSTCAYLAALLQSQGVRVGVYASPHLQHYGERVKIAGQEATDQQLCQAFAAVELARGDISLTYFEMGTLAAFWLFSRAELDAVVLEVGLGGRLDAVNVVDADLAIITTIGLDHTDWLGHTRQAVAQEKAGIMRKGKPVLCGDPEPPEVLNAIAQQQGAILLQRGLDFDSYEHNTGQWSWWGQSQEQRLQLNTQSSLALPQESAALALQAYVTLGYPWVPEVLQQVLGEQRMSGRLDLRQITYRGKSCRVLLDVGHNAQAAAYLAKYLAKQPSVGQRHAVFGLLSDKDLEAVVRPLLPWIDHWALVTLDCPRARSADNLQNALVQQGALCITQHPNVAAALVACCEPLQPEDEVLVFGSFYCVADALTWLQSLTMEMET